MNFISEEKYLTMLPQAADPDREDVKYYHNLANELLNLWRVSGIMPDVDDKVKDELVLCVTGYFMDICSDIGLWRAFRISCSELCGRKLPFYNLPESYIEDELNIEDIRFLVWYVFSMYRLGNSVPSPEKEDFRRLAELLYVRLDECYEDAPSLQDLFGTRDLEMHDQEDSRAIMELASWVYWRAYLIRPALDSNIGDIMQGIDRSDQEALVRRMNEAAADFPTGPTALYLREWITLLLEHKLPAHPAAPHPDGNHPYYERFIKATGGKRLEFFATYSDLNRFFIEKMGWEEGTQHLPAMRDSRDFALFVSPEKGMLVARDVARCIAAPGNKLYDKEYARKNAFSFLTVRGACPGDLLRYICAQGWLPDTHFPGSDSHELVEENHDFIARCFLQLYYRD